AAGLRARRIKVRLGYGGHVGHAATILLYLRKRGQGSEGFGGHGGPPLAHQRIELLRIDSQLADRSPRERMVDAAAPGELVQGGDGDALGVHLEEAAQRLAGVAAAEAVGAQAE